MYILGVWQYPLGSGVTDSKVGNRVNDPLHTSAAILVITKASGQAAQREVVLAPHQKPGDVDPGPLGRSCLHILEGKIEGLCWGSTELTGQVTPPEGE